MHLCVDTNDRCGHPESGAHIINTYNPACRVGAVCQALGAACLGQAKGVLTYFTNQPPGSMKKEFWR